MKENTYKLTDLCESKSEINEIHKEWIDNGKLKSIILSPYLYPDIIKQLENQKIIEENKTQL